MTEFIDDDESGDEQSFQRIRPSPFVVDIATATSSQNGDDTTQDSKTPPHRTPTRPIPPAPLKRKFNPSSGASRNVDDDDNDDATQIDEARDQIRDAIAELLPAAAIAPRSAGDSGTVPVTPSRTQPPTVANTPIVSPQQNVFSNALVRRMRRYAKIATRQERFAEAKKLLPWLTRYEMERDALDVVALFNLPAGEAITKEMLNAPFLSSAVWRDAFRQAFPRFVSEFAGDMLPDFYNVDESEYDAVRRWRTAQRNMSNVDDDNNRNSSETSLATDEPPHGTWQQWRHYFVLVDDLFKQMMLLTVIAMHKAPRGEWREFYCRGYNDVTCHQVVDRPEEAIFVPPEQFGVVGDVYDLALSVFDPMAALPQFGIGTVSPLPAERFSIVRWYDAVLWEEYSKKYTSFDVDSNRGTATREAMFARRSHSTLDQLRFFVRTAPDQFLRSRFILKTGAGYQWAGYGNQLDEVMLDSVPWADIGDQTNRVFERKRRLEAVLSTENRSLRVLARLLNSRQRQRLKRARLALGVASSSSQSSIVSEYVDDANNDDDESVLQEQLENARARTERHQSELEELNSQLQALNVMANEKADRVVQVAVFETSAVNQPTVKVPLQAQDFALVQRSAPNDERAVPATPGSIREIEFSDSDDGDHTTVAPTMSNVLQPRHATLFDPNTHNRRIVYQAKFNVLLTHTLRFYTGWVNAENGLFPKPFWLEYMQRLEHTRFVHESLFATEHVSNFIIWLMQKHVERRDTSEMFRNYYAYPGFSTQPDFEPDDEMFVPNSLTQTLAEENLSAVDRIGDIVQKKAYPYLLEYADSANDQQQNE